MISNIDFSRRVADLYRRRFEAVTPDSAASDPPEVWIECLAQAIVDRHRSLTAEVIDEAALNYLGKHYPDLHNLAEGCIISIETRWGRPRTDSGEEYDLQEGPNRRRAWTAARLVLETITRWHLRRPSAEKASAPVVPVSGTDWDQIVKTLRESVVEILASNQQADADRPKVSQAISGASCPPVEESRAEHLSPPTNVNADYENETTDAQALVRASKHESDRESIDSQAPNLFKPYGDMFFIRFRGSPSRPVPIKTCIGMKHIYQLILSPGKNFEPSDFARGRRAGGTLRGVTPVEADYYQTPSPDPMFDHEAKKAVKDRLGSVLRDLEKARKNDDEAEAERLTQEKAELEEYLLKNTGLNGRIRSQSSNETNLPRSVRTAIGRAFKKIEKHLPELADHLKRNIECASSFAYRAGDEVSWVCR